MGLGFGGARADGRPSDEVRDVLGDDRVEKFCCGRQPQIGDVQQKAAGQFKARLDVLGIVQMRVVDQSLPADGGAGFFKVDAHDDFHAVGELVA